jgi:hypothetical protein
VDNTLIVLMSDNGASGRRPTGAINQKHMVYEEEPRSASNISRNRQEWAFNHYPTGWAQASNTPLKWYKKDTHGGGIRAPLIAHWPSRIGSRGAVRAHYHHVSDIAPTFYEVLGIDPPQEYRGVPQLPIHGTSLAYTFDDGEARTHQHPVARSSATERFGTTVEGRLAPRQRHGLRGRPVVSSPRSRLSRSTIGGVKTRSASLSGRFMVGTGKYGVAAMIRIGENGNARMKTTTAHT